MFNRLVRRIKGTGSWVVNRGIPKLSKGVLRVGAALIVLSACNQVVERYTSMANISNPVISPVEAMQYYYDASPADPTNYVLRDNRHFLEITHPYGYTTAQLRTVDVVKFADKLLQSSPNNNDGCIKYVHLLSKVCDRPTEVQKALNSGAYQNLFNNIDKFGSFQSAEPDEDLSSHYVASYSPLAKFFRNSLDISDKNIENMLQVENIGNKLEELKTHQPTTFCIVLAKLMNFSSISTTNQNIIQSKNIDLNNLYQHLNQHLKTFVDFSRTRPHFKAEKFNEELLRWFYAGAFISCCSLVGGIYDKVSTRSILASIGRGMVGYTLLRGLVIFSHNILTQKVATSQHYWANTPAALFTSEFFIFAFSIPYLRTWRYAILPFALFTWLSTERKHAADYSNYVCRKYNISPDSKFTNSLRIKFPNFQSEKIKM